MSAACPSCASPLAQNSKVDVVPGGLHNIRRSLRARPQAAAEARRAVVGLALPEPTRQTLAQLVSELVTNSILHGGLGTKDTVDLEVNNGGTEVRIAVHDRGMGFTAPAPKSSGLPAPNPDRLHVGGLGLVIAAALSETWGVDCDIDGCTVWCNVATEQEPKSTLEHKVTTSYVRELAIEMARASASPAS
jgi:anti-sigma regulatory factor (Ser/Thr protein kinase)